MVKCVYTKHKASLRKMSEIIEFIWSRNKAQTVDALAVRGEEGRGILRKAQGSWNQALILGCPNGGTQP